MGDPQDSDLEPDTDESGEPGDRPGRRRFGGFGYRPQPGPRSGPTSLFSALDLLRREYGLREPTQTEERFQRAWREAAGPELARQAPLMRSRGGELLVEVASAALYHELVGYRQQDLARRLADALPPGSFKRLIIRRQS